MALTGSAGSPLDSAPLKVQLILTAERLFAVHGLEGVSLRQIASEAGTANTSAVHYHFGTKDQLVEAILLHRLPHLNQRREILDELSSGTDLRSELEAHVLPLLEQAQIGGSHYLTFVERLISHAIGANPLAHLAPDYRDWYESFRARILRHLHDLPDPVGVARVRYVTTMALHVAAARERALRAGSPVPPLRLELAQLLDALAGLLGAPASEDTVAAIATARANGASVRREVRP